MRARRRTQNHETDESEIDEAWARLEYEYAHERWTNGTNQRRAGLAFLTTVQGTIITIIGTNLFHMDGRARALVIFAIVVAISGYNHEKRIGSYMRGYRRRAIELEERHGLRLFQYGVAEAKAAKTMSNRKLFRWYFVLILTAWTSVLIFDLAKAVRRLFL
jgi:hypothetical protein